MESEKGSMSEEQRAYNYYLDVYLPERKEFRPYAGKPETQAYKIGFEHFKKNLRSWSERAREGRAWGTYMDQDSRKACGGILSVGTKAALTSCHKDALPGPGYNSNAIHL
ncbi:hypothetical protein COCOBI_10-1320 [Coccomyxa sp. Obi]|nr:hypothetical protein COCOBI_10-1320 [Coccomyxa sp. Obi]